MLNKARNSILLVLLMLFFIFVANSSCLAKGWLSSNYAAMNAIVVSADMSKEEKIRKLRGFLVKNNWPAVLYQIAKVDKSAAQNIALELFRRKTTLREQKLALGRLLFQELRTPESVKEYAAFLVEAVLKGGEEEFMTKRDRKPSAIGEYAFIASDFEGYSSEDFEMIKDKRVIPVLIKALDAPDILNPIDKGDLIIKVIPPARRNVSRQQVPIALAKLEAFEAIDALQRILAKHHDYWLKYNSAYALALLMKRTDSKVLEKSLRKSENQRWFLFPFGKGLIEKGDVDGIEFMAFQYSKKFNNGRLSYVLYMLNERLNLLKSFKSKKTELFYKQALEYKPLYNILTADLRYILAPNDKKVRDVDDMQYFERNRQWIITAYKKIIEGIRINRLNSLSHIISKISKETKQPGIKKISEEYLHGINYITQDN